MVSFVTSNVVATLKRQKLEAGLHSDQTSLPSTVGGFRLNVTDGIEH